MKFLKILPYIFAFTFVSCLKDKSTLAENNNNEEEAVDTVLHITPLKSKLSKPSRAYVNSKTATIEHFYNKLWSRNDLSGGFLVAKNGKILFEKYGGYSNRNEKEEI